MRIEVYEYLLLCGDNTRYERLNCCIGLLVYRVGIACDGRIYSLQVPMNDITLDTSCNDFDCKEYPVVTN